MAEIYIRFEYIGSGNLDYRNIVSAKLVKDRYTPYSELRASVVLNNSINLYNNSAVMISWRENSVGANSTVSDDFYIFTATDGRECRGEYFISDGENSKKDFAENSGKASCSNGWAEGRLLRRQVRCKAESA